jgi:hypothetical protein
MLTTVTSGFVKGNVCSIFCVDTNWAVNLQHPHATTANAADVVECERRRAEAVVLEVEFDRVLAR